MKVTRIRKLKRSGISEITLRVSSKESEKICHAVNCMHHIETNSIYLADLQRAGLKLLESLTEPKEGVFWTTWGV